LTYQYFFDIVAKACTIKQEGIIMTPGQFFEMAMYAAVIAYVLKIFIDAWSGKKAKKIIGDDINEIIRKELDNDETLLYSKKQRSYKGFFVFSLLFSAFIFMICFLFVAVDMMEGFTWDNSRTFSSLITIGVFLGTGIVIGFYGSHFMFKAENTLYFITNKRVCITTVTTSKTKVQDILAEEIKKINIGAVAPTRRTIEKDIQIRTSDGRKFKLRPADNLHNMAKVIHQIIGTTPTTQRKYF
jgi:hypothetical protein